MSDMETIERLLREILTASRGDQPAMIALRNAKRVRAMYDVSSATWLRWHDLEGAPVFFPHGRGRGKQGYIPTQKALQWIARKATVSG